MCSNLNYIGYLRIRAISGCHQNIIASDTGKVGTWNGPKGQSETIGKWWVIISQRYPTDYLWIMFLILIIMNWENKVKTVLVPHLAWSSFLSFCFVGYYYVLWFISLKSNWIRKYQTMATGLIGSILMFILGKNW